MDEKSIFLDALNKPAGDERMAWLNDVCGRNLPLRQRIEALRPITTTKQPKKG